MRTRTICRSCSEAESDGVGPGMGLRFRVWNKFPDAAAAAGLWATLGKARPLGSINFLQANDSQMDTSNPDLSPELQLLVTTLS